MKDDKNTAFVSYSRKDSLFALRLAVDLKSAGFQVWIDQMDIPAGSRWDDEVQKALVKCDVFIVILTPEASVSQNVKDEIGYAIDTGKRILPILLKDCNTPLRLRHFQYVDFKILDYEHGVDTVIRLLTSLLDEAETASVYKRSTNLVPKHVPPQKPASLRKESLFKRILNRLAGDSTTDAPPPKKKD